MRHIKTFDYVSANLKKKQINRFAVRAIIIENKQLLMCKLEKTGEYKFPGGGVEHGEDFEQALIRETLEEAGAQIIKIKQEIGYIDQIWQDKYEHDRLFYMRSVYYLVAINQPLQKTNLSQAEQRLGFKPVWVPIALAIKLNRTRMSNGTIYHWTERETYMLEYIKKNIIK